MRPRAALTLALLAGLMVSLSGFTADDRIPQIRYRGDLTFGHEARSFCPAINSQCYWLSSQTPADVIAELQNLVLQGTQIPYSPICIVVAGSIDRESSRSGFAADYDGLFTVTRIFGLCEKTTLVTDGDLQHHRWILNHINGEPVTLAEPDSQLPEIEFGARMTLSGYAGCNRFNGQATLHEETLRAGQLAVTMRACGLPGDDIERTLLTVLGSDPAIKIDTDKNLLLKSANTELQFRLSDWK